jgi:hypothetical protein
MFVPLPSGSGWHLSPGRPASITAPETGDSLPGSASGLAGVSLACAQPRRHPGPGGAGRLPTGAGVSVPQKEAMLYAKRRP